MPGTTKEPPQTGKRSQQCEVRGLVEHVPDLAGASARAGVERAMAGIPTGARGHVVEPVTLFVGPDHPGEVRQRVPVAPQVDEVGAQDEPPLAVVDEGALDV